MGTPAVRTVCCAGCQRFVTGRYSARATYCSRECYWRHHPGPKPSNAASRFWAKVNKDGPVVRPNLGACWIWTGARYPSGYGASVYEGHQTHAHRVSWQMKNGPLPDGMWVLHHCDNRPCVRPDHLFEGTAQDNVDDMMKKGRNGYRRFVGSDHGMARLTPQEVAEIRALAGRQPVAETARQFGVSWSHTKRIQTGEAWSSVA